jgi:hypothetical protein
VGGCGCGCVADVMICRYVFSWGKEVIDSSGKRAVARSSAGTVCSFADHDEHFNLAGLPARFQSAVMLPTSKSILERNFPFQEI